MINTIVEKIVGRLLRSAGLPGKRALFEREKTCVVTALEHATGTRAPKGTRERRARDIYGMLYTLVQNDLHEGIRQKDSISWDNYKDFQEHPLRMELPNIKSLIRDVRRTMTPMGEALRQRPFRVDNVSEREIRSMLRSGENVVIVGKARGTETGIQFCHAGHIAEREGDLVDTVLNVPVRLPHKGKVAAIIFSKKR